jgi:hypothetical protein
VITVTESKEGNIPTPVPVTNVALVGTRAVANALHPWNARVEILDTVEGNSIAVNPVQSWNDCVLID